MRSSAAGAEPATQLFRARHEHEQAWDMIGTADEPLRLISVTRSIIADALTPITAYLALATPGRSCLLESVEGTDRISRFSFIGTDYLESRAFDDSADMLGQ